MGALSKMLGGFSARGKATSLYKLGIKRAGDRDTEGAISAYTDVIKMNRAPLDVRAMALLNRALAYSLLHDNEKAHVDLSAVMEIPQAPAQVIAAAKDKLHRMRRSR